MSGPCFEVNFPPSKNLWKPFLTKYPINIHAMAATSGFLKTLLLTFLTRPSLLFMATIYIFIVAMVTILLADNQDILRITMIFCGSPWYFPPACWLNRNRRLLQSSSSVALSYLCLLSQDWKYLDSNVWWHLLLLFRLSPTHAILLAPWDIFLAPYDTFLYHITPSWHHVTPSWHSAKSSWHQVITSWHHTILSCHFKTPSWHLRI